MDQTSLQSKSNLSQDNTSQNTVIKQQTILSQKQAKIQQLRKWMKQKGCIIHPSVQIPSFVNGYQGVGTNALIPHKTVVIAVPSSLILTVQKCYKDPQLKSIFSKNDDLFDYQASDDAQFNVLCVFLMYHKLNIDKSPWRIYLQTIGQPQTAIDWPDKMLKGFNKSAIEQIIHIRLQCDKLRDQLSQYLKKTSKFGQFSLQQIKQCFNYCYRAVMTRCFGYYFGQASLIPVADLINHGCQVVDHQLINTRLQITNSPQYSSYSQKSEKIDCSILGIRKGSHIMPPFRQRYLIMNGLIQNDIQKLSNLSRKQIDNLIGEYNKQLLQQQEIQINSLNFCQQDDSQDNDTDVDQQNQRQLQLQRLQLQQLQQIQNFKKYHSSILVQTYKQVQDRFQLYQKQLNLQSNNISNNNQSTQTSQSRNNILIKGIFNTQQQLLYTTNTQFNTQNTSNTSNVQNTLKLSENILSIQQTHNIQNIQIQSSNSQQQSLFFENKNFKKQPQIPKNKHIQKPNPKAIVPVQMIDSSSSESQDDQQWGLLPQSYFTLSTSSAVGANKQLYNSYGSRTNKFLLIWYGFCYRNNLFDSVSLRLHVQFHKTLPNAQQMVLDTYIGGQGRSFRKNYKQMVKQNQVSRQFRLKLTKLCTKLLTFLRLYLLDYYKGLDLYKICVTIPSSIEFQLFVLNFYKQIIISLYQRYPLKIIEQLKQELQSEKTKSENKQKINFKIIYLQEQRKILDQSLDTVNCVIKVWQRIKQQKQQCKSNKNISTAFDKGFYKDFTIFQLRKMQPYLISLKNNYSYVLYEQQLQKNQQ